MNLKLRCVSEICLNDQEYLNNTFSFIKTHHNLTIQPFPTVFQSYKIQLENSDDTSIILIGIFLHFNQSAIGNYKLVMNFNETETDSFQLNKNQISLKLMDYYQLDDSSKENINNTVKFSTSGNLASGISMYLNTFLQSDSSFTFRTFMIIEYIYILRFINLNYPINVIEFFRNKISSPKFFLKHDIENEKSDKFLIEGILQLYGVNSYFLNNFGEIMINFIIIFGFAHVFNIFFNIFYAKSTNKDIILYKVLKIIYEAIVWFIVIIYISSNYLTLCFFSSLNLIYRPLNSYMGQMNFSLGFISFMCSIGVILNLFFIIKIIKQKLKFEAKENQNKILIKNNEVSSNQISTNDLSHNFGEENKVLKLKSRSTSLKLEENHPKQLAEANLSPIKENSKEWSGFIEDFKMEKDRSLPNIEKTNEKQPKIFSLKRKKTKFGVDNQPWDISPVRDKNPIENLSDLFPTMHTTRDEPEKLSSSKLIAQSLAQNSNNEEGDTKIEKIEKAENAKIIKKRFLRNLFQVKNLERFIGKYDAIYNDFKQNTRFSHYLMIFDFLRYFLIAIAVAMLQEHYLITTIALFLINFIFIGYLFIFFPFKEKSKNILTIITELANMLATTAALIIAICDYNEIYDPYIRLNAGWMIIYANIILIAVILMTFALIFLTICLNLLKAIRKALKYRFQVSPFNQTQNNLGSNEAKTSELEKNLPEKPKTFKISLIQVGYS